MTNPVTGVIQVMAVSCQYHESEYAVAEQWRGLRNREPNLALITAGEAREAEITDLCLL